MQPSQVVATPTTDIRFDFAGVTVGFESRPVGGLVSDSFTSLDGAVRLSAFAQVGQLGTLAVASNSAALGESLAQFTDSVTAVGSRVASIAQTLSAGTLGSTAGQAAVIAACARRGGLAGRCASALPLAIATAILRTSGFIPT